MSGKAHRPLLNHAERRKLARAVVAKNLERLVKLENFGVLVETEWPADAGMTFQEYMERSFLMRLVKANQ
jgi:hypothetical protein